MIRVALFLLLLCAANARAGDDGLEGTYTEPSPTPTTNPDGSSDAGTPADAQGDDAAPAPRYVPLPKKDLRFLAEDSERFRHWVARLCAQPSTEPERTDRVRAEADGTRTRTRATNKLGSAVLLLENYAELAEFRDGCAEKRKKSADACTHKGRLPRPGADPKAAEKFPWLAVGSGSFQKEVATNRSPAGVAHAVDLQRAAEDELRSIEEELRKDKDFFELKNASELTGKTGSGGAARALSAQIRNASTCGVRYVSETRETEAPRASRRPAQK